MAQHTVRPGMQFNPVSRFRITGNNAKRAEHSYGSDTILADYSDHYNCDERLTAINPTKYTQQYLDTMNLNDKRYAIRLNDFPTDIRG